MSEKKPMLELSSFKHTLKEALIYIWLGMREIFRHKKFLLSYFLVVSFLSAVISFVTTQIYLDGWPRLSAWYNTLCLYVTMVAANIFVIQSVLGRYRKINLNKRTVGLCVLWSISFTILYSIASFLFRPVDNYLMLQLPTHDQYFIIAKIHRLVVDIVVAVSMIWLGFYPFLLLEKVKMPLQENLKLIKKNGFKLAVCWVIVWYTVSAIRNIIKIDFENFLLANDLSMNPILLGFMFITRHFLVDVLLILPPAVITTVAFLRITGERDFQDKSKLPTLIKDKGALLP